MTTLRHQAAELAAGAPPVTVAGMTLWGYGVSDWVQVLAALWLVIQIGWFVWKNFIRKDKRKED